MGHRAHRDIAHRGAISDARFAELMRSVTPSADTSQAQGQAIRQQSDISQIMCAHGLGEASAAVICEKPFVKPAIEQFEKAGAKITQVEFYHQKCIVTIESPGNKGDVAKFRVRENSQFSLEKEPKSEALRQIVEKLTAKPERPEQTNMVSVRDFGH